MKSSDDRQAGDLKSVVSRGSPVPVRACTHAIDIDKPAAGAVSVVEINRRYRVEGNRNAYPEPGYAESKFIVSFVENALQVGEDGMHCGGHKVAFTGRYPKQRRH